MQNQNVGGRLLEMSSGEDRARPGEVQARPGEDLARTGERKAVAGREGRLFRDF